MVKIYEVFNDEEILHTLCTKLTWSHFRKLRCLVVVELNYLEKYEMNEGENPPIGIILCSSKEAEVVELMKLDETRIHVAEVITRTLAEKLPEAIDNAKILMEQRKLYIENE